MHVGISGTRAGMTPEQRLTVFRLFESYGPVDVLHHGDCIGVDAQVHAIACERKLRTVAHPCTITSQRAFTVNDVEYEAIAPLDRNRKIVAYSEFIIIVPKEFDEQYRGSGTWATYRYAKQAGKKGVIVFPDGTERKFNCFPL